MSFLIIVILIILLWPVWRILFSRLMQWVVLYFLKKQTGIDFGSGNKSRKSKNKKEQQQRQQKRRRNQGPIIPKEYAEDVEFTEIMEFQDTTIVDESGSGTRVYRESQVSDVEFVEIKNSPKK